MSVGVLAAKGLAAQVAEVGVAPGESKGVWVWNIYEIIRSVLPDKNQRKSQGLGQKSRKKIVTVHRATFLLHFYTTIF